MEEAVQSSKVHLLSTDHYSPVSNTWRIPFDPSLKEVTVALSGPAPNIEIRNPQGRYRVGQVSVLIKSNLLPFFFKSDTRNNNTNSDLLNSQNTSVGLTKTLTCYISVFVESESFSVHWIDSHEIDSQSFITHFFFSWVSCCSLNVHLSRTNGALMYIRNIVTFLHRETDWEQRWTDRVASHPQLSQDSQPQRPRAGHVVHKGEHGATSSSRTQNKVTWCNMIRGKEMREGERSAGEQRWGYISQQVSWDERRWGEVRGDEMKKGGEMRWE